ncbi:ribbon-helix-helix domain-containing protein [Pseudanabaena sp. PCC 6802]|nr:ribbon-helix-helix domain-containing protein [Pseudanabaena sp. PCC 6802]
MKRSSLRLSDEEYAKVSEYAEKTEQSINDVIRQIIREWKPKS